MLTAIASGKFRGSGVDGYSGFAGSEDLLTASIFERLVYLPDECLIGVLRRLPGMVSCTPAVWGRLSEAQFWPRFEADDQGHVEPDVVLIFELVVVAIEAKRHDRQLMQHDLQLHRQRLAIERSLDMTGKSVVHVALGGNAFLAPSTQPKKVQGWSEIRSHWEDLRRACDSAAETPSEARIIADIMTAFTLHGLVECPGFEGLTPVGIEHSVMPPMR